MKIFRLLPFLLPTDLRLEKQLERLRRAIEDGGIRLEKVKFLDGTANEDIALTSGSTVEIYHGLNRKPKGWFVTRAQTSAASLYETDRDDEKLTLYAGNTGTVDIWIF